MPSNCAFYALYMHHSDYISNSIPTLEPIHTPKFVMYFGRMPTIVNRGGGIIKKKLYPIFGKKSIGVNKDKTELMPQYRRVKKNWATK